MFRTVIIPGTKVMLSFANRHSWWSRDQATAAAALPGLQRAGFNLVQGDGADGYSGVSEMCFDSEQMYKNAAGSEAQCRAAADFDG